MYKNVDRRSGGVGPEESFALARIGHLRLGSATEDGGNRMGKREQAPNGLIEQIGGRYWRD
jgi:hypothetical protein